MSAMYVQCQRTSLRGNACDAMAAAAGGLPRNNPDSADCPPASDSPRVACPAVDREANFGG